MKTNESKLLVFGGTTEGRQFLSELSKISKLSKKALQSCIYCVATDYGASFDDENFKSADVRVGRLDVSQIEELIKRESVRLVIDATHPYAVNVSENISAACTKCDIQVIRIVRNNCDNLDSLDIKDIIKASSYEEAVSILNSRTGNALITTGSKGLAAFTAVKDYKTRLYPRVLPTSEVIASCEKLGFAPQNIIAMQGPFSHLLNRALLRASSAKFLVTKDGGSAGGLAEKLLAAKEEGARVILITRPKEEMGYSVDEAVTLAAALVGAQNYPVFPLLIDISDKTAVVIGGGKIAARRAAVLLTCGAHVKAIAPRFDENFPKAAQKITRAYEKGDLDGAVLAVAATNVREVNARAAQEAAEKNIPISVADCKAECTFYFPALINEQHIMACVSTSGQAPEVASKLSRKLKEVLSTWIKEIMQNERESK